MSSSKRTAAPHRKEAAPTTARRTGYALWALLLIVLSNTARADIVWEGRTVSAWPEGAYDERLPVLGPGNQQAIKVYPAPKGTVWGLTILVDFSDQQPAFGTKAIDAWLNQRHYTIGGLNGSVRDYYWDVSNGAVDFRNDVVGFYRAKRPKSYYEDDSGYTRSSELFAEVIAAIDPMVDFAKYDNDKDGSTDAISIVYAGDAKTFAQGLWPHASGSNIRADGVTIKRYMMTALSNKLTLYTFCHEVGHMLFGWPDLYGFGDYCLMGNRLSDSDPAGINDFFRADQGWIPEVEITPDMNVRATATINGSGFRYTNPADPGECFFWSNIQNQGRWKILQGSGLLFLHYKRSIRTNDPPNPLALAVVQADGRNELDKTNWPSPGSDAKDFFFGGGVRELSDSTRPSARWMDGTSSGLRVYDIGASGSAMRFAVGKLPPTGEIPQPDAGASDAGTDEPDASGDPNLDATVATGRTEASVAVDASVPDAMLDAAIVQDSSAAPQPALPSPTDGMESQDEHGADGCSLRARGRDSGSAGVGMALAMLGITLLSRRKRTAAH